MNPYQSFLAKEGSQILQQLQADTKRQWGLMDAQQMVEHLTLTFMLSVSDIEVGIMGTEEQAQKAYHIIFVKKKPFQRGVKIPVISAEPVAYEYENIELAKDALLASIQAFYKYHEAHPQTKKVHPAFGALNFKDWEEFHARHLQHHLAQFGLWTIAEK